MQSGVGQAAMVNELPDKLTVFSGFIIRFRKRTDILINDDYLNYLVRSEFYRNYIRRLISGTTITNINQEFLSKLPIILPSISEQNEIVNVISCLDDTIELNQRMNKTLEAIGQALFRRWFVDFEFPNEEGKPYKSSGGEMVYSEELGKEIPKGWNSGIINEILLINKNAENPIKNQDIDYLHFSIPAYDAGQNPQHEFGESIKSMKYVVLSDSILLSKLNPEISRVWLVDVSSNERAICSTEFLVITAKSPFNRSYIYHLICSPEFSGELKGLVTGTSKSHQRVQPESVLRMKIIIPDSRILEKFKMIVTPLHNIILSNRYECSNLGSIRDAILPKLISGQIRVNRRHQ